MTNAQVIIAIANAKYIATSSQLIVGLSFPQNPNIEPVCWIDVRNERQESAASARKDLFTCSPETEQRWRRQNKNEDPPHIPAMVTPVPVQPLTMQYCTPPKRAKVETLMPIKYTR